MTGSIGRIPWTAVDQYAKRYPVFEEDFEVFELYIKVLDEKLLQLVKDNKPKGNRPERPPLTPKSKIGRS
jgi:hypothetical protein